MSFWSALKHDVATVFTGAVKVAELAAPAISLLAPSVAPLYNATINAAIKAEAVSAAVNAANGTGPHKLALVVKEIEGVYNDYAKANGVTPVPADVERWVNAVVATLNSLPQPLPDISVSV